ncbi:MAG: heme biosynthesis HemY N-terminal domain-containing protein [Pseudomonadales bacterium]
MKLGVLLVIVAVVLGGLVGTLVVRDPGYVLVSYGDMAVETSLWFALIALAVLYLSVRLVLWILSRSGEGTGRFGSWLKTRKVRQARQQTVQGLLLMAEGQWADARKILVASAREVGTPLINYLSAARAAHELGDAAGRDELLRRAHESTPGSRFAVGLTQAELQMDGGQWEQSLATLLQLKSNAPRHPQVLSMLCQTYRQLADWQALIELLPEVKKRRIFDDAAFEALQREAWTGRLKQAGADAAGVWADLPKELKRQGDLVAVYASALISGGAAEAAEGAVRGALQQGWNDDLVTLYGQIVGPDPNRQMLTAESWLKERPNDPQLLLALGRISLMNGEWAKAREYFETSLRLQRSAQVYGELGRLCVALGDSDRGGEYLVQATEGLPALPLPEGPVPAPG